MTNPDIRRQRLRQWIDAKHGGNITAFADSIGRKQPQISDVLAGAKSFGEKLARRIEDKAGMPKRYLDGPDVTGQLTALYHGVKLTRSGALLGAEWEKLPIDLRADFEEKILAAVAKHIRSQRPRDPDDTPPPEKPQ